MLNSTIVHSDIVRFIKINRPNWIGHSERKEEIQIDKANILSEAYK